MPDAPLNLILAVVALLTGIALLRPRLRNRRTWRAMVTPLASIIGSGFLIIGPVLEKSFGYFAPLAMLALCALAWAYGGAVRVNIARIGDGDDPRPALDQRIETVASAMLAFAYMISVAYYLNLFGAFAVSLTPWDSALSARIVTSAMFVIILVTGWTSGFAALERMEYSAVAVKLAVIAALLVGLSLFASGKAVSGDLVFNPPELTGWAALTLTMGLLVTVQGFETSRYLGATYQSAVRIRSMRWAQSLSSAIYLFYIVALAYVFRKDQLQFSETAIVDMMAIVAPVLPALLVVAALAAQFSAAVADTSGSGGLIAELTRGRIHPALAYALLTAVGLAQTWAVDVFQIITFASRAFAAYYALQAGLAALGDWRDGRRARAIAFGLLAIFGAAIVVFGQPVEGEAGQ
ncbi:hypothetical protein [Pseudooceanicola sp.]|uniref:hypothetical protein n=1 Tax=Pseudooceanicola sp. TaxID=1914328 RepID=UPI0026323BD1|nr:hypothetical protein [Pseudooceanicola sp.]MDF1856733.1 hypothetical protein [Pseudooceanicola sp.]